MLLLEEEKEIFNTKVKIKLNLHVETYQILHKCLYYFIQASSIFEFGDNVELCHNIINRLEENAIYKK